jgi:M6 family metalloprotease-like protein
MHKKNLMILCSILFTCVFIAIAVPCSTSAIDLSKGIMLDVPQERIEPQFGKMPPSRLTRQDSIALASYRFTADTLKVLAILVEWFDRPHTYSRGTFDSLLFSRNSLPGGSVADYFYEVSYGQANVVGEVRDWYDAGTYDVNFDFESLFPILDPVIDYSQFDGDHNGDVDAVVFIRSGNGMEDSHDPNDIWSYAYVYPPGSGPGPYDGVHIPRWNTSPETQPLHDSLNPHNFSGVHTLNKIRVFCHELTHCFGLPDLYDYDDKLDTTTYYTPGDYNDHPVNDWCLMGYYGYGLFSIGSQVPSHLCGWSKKEMGWITPLVLPKGIPNNVVIYNIETTNDSSLYLVPINLADGEYFLLEYRNPNSTAKFDKINSDYSCYFWPALSFGGDPLDRGLLITHVHDSLGAYYWRINDGTPTYSHYTVKIEDAGYNPSRDAYTNPEGWVTDSAQWWYPYESQIAASFSNDVSGQEVFDPTTYPNSDGYYGPSGIFVRVDSIINDKLYAYIYIPTDSIPFAPAVNYATGSAPNWVFSADLNGDGDLDLAIADGIGSVSILNNNGNGQFPTKADYGAGDGPVSVFCADLDGDLDLDLAVANQSSDNVSILKNNGSGIFQSAVNYGTGDSPFSVFCADLDGDCDLDLAVANYYSYSVSILKNNGNGTFQTKVDYGTGWNPFSVFCADLDGDGDLDLAVANAGSNNVSILKNNGDGTFQSAVNYGAGDLPMSVFCADLDGDLDLDLAVANFSSDNVSIFVNTGNGTFQPADNYPTGDGPQSVFSTDLDGDGDFDLVTANCNSGNASILENNGNATFQSKVDYAVGNGPYSVFCADLDGDGDFDLALANHWDNNVSILKNLTQIPANQPPWAFSLISPADQDTIFGSATFQWQIPYDPNFGDQMRYDLYISMSPSFEPLYTTVDSNLAMSKFITAKDSGTYYWKVKAKDNWGAERWSTQTWSIVSRYLTDTLRVIAFSPVDLIVTDPAGDSIGLAFNTIPGANYDTTHDVTPPDGDKDDIVTIPNRLVGVYVIRVFPEPVADKATYSLGIRIDGSDLVMLATDQPCPDPGEVATLSYNAPWFMRGDVNGDWGINITDVVYLINYLFLIPPGPAPEPLETGDVNCDGVINVQDVVYLINYLFLVPPGPPPCS